MNLFSLSAAYVRRAPSAVFLNALMMGMGVATIIFLLLFLSQLETKVTRDAQGVDLVVGAKGSPLQIILAGVFHADIPTGNIRIAEARTVATNRLVASAIPLSLGDSFQGVRIVGTTKGFLDHYKAVVAEGVMWSEPLEAIVGASAAKRLGLSLGDRFYGAHGLGKQGSEEHSGHAYTVTGILAPAGAVVDELILTSLESVWEVHGMQQDISGHRHDAQPADHRIRDDSWLSDPATPGKDITMILVRFASPVAAAILPRQINTQTSMQAASPAFETARLLRNVGVGADVLKVFGLLLIGISILGTFIALAGAVRGREFDIALMRSLGASPSFLFWHIVIEGFIISLVGSLIGLLLGHALVELLGAWFSESWKMRLDGLTFIVEEFYVVAGSVVVGMLASALPAWKAYRLDIARILAEG